MMTNYGNDKDARYPSGIHASQVRTRIIEMMIIIVTNYGNDKDARYLSGIHASQVRTRIRE